MSNDKSEATFHPEQPPVPIQLPTPVPASQHHANPARQFEHKPVKQSADRAQYVRQQKGHSLTLHLILGVVVLWANVVYYSVSPNHYWHA
jgi:hypothetical protein